MTDSRRDDGKALVPLLGILAALAMGVAAVAIVLLLQERDRSAAKERELVIVRAEKDDLKGQLEEVRVVKASIEAELATAKETLEQTKAELTETTAANMMLSKSVESRQEEIDRLVKDLEQLRNERKGLNDQVARLQTDQSQLQQQVETLETAKSELETKVLELSDHPTVELDKVVVSGESSETSGAGATAMPVSYAGGTSQGQVVVVNREYDFIVMNLGKNHGLSIGQEFQVVQGSEVLGKVKVEKVYDELSAAAILPGSKKDRIREGDSVTAL
jgi:septal ring factor EnvC (AmiA/AmiB activator)